LSAVSIAMGACTGSTGRLIRGQAQQDLKPTTSLR
jgi:hypothetical protein